MINWQYFPKSEKIPDSLFGVIKKFEENYYTINSDQFIYSSDIVLKKLSSDLESLGFIIEKSKRESEKIKIPVLFGKNGKLEKSFDADGYNAKTNTVIEIEAGRAVTNYQFLKDLFQACMMHDVNYLIIAVRNIYLKKNKDFETVLTFFNTLYASGRLSLPLKGILIIGY